MDATQASTLARIILLLAVLGGAIGLSKSIEKGTRRDEDAIANIVTRSREFHRQLTKIKADTSALLDPLVFVLEIDRRYRDAGLGYMPLREFRQQLAEANQRLIGSSSEEYIDAAAQRREIEKRMRYEGIHGEVEALPGWDRPSGRRR